jgi:PAS domain S-box-containing protein
MAIRSKKSNLLLRRIVGYSFICAICLVFFSASFEFYSTYNREIKRINDSLDQIEQTQVKTLIDSAWSLNYKSILIQFQSLVQHPDIIYLEFSDTHNENKIFAGKKPVSLNGIISRAIPLNFIDDGKEVSLGTFHLLVSTEPTKKIIYQRIPLIALSECIKIIILCGLIIWLIHHLINRHLSQIAKFTNSLDIDKLHNRLILQRKAEGAGQTDELSQIVQAINEMQDRITEGLRQKEQAETALRKSKEMFQFATDSASLGIWDWNMENNKTYFNPVYLTMLGYEENERPHSYETWYKLIHPDDRGMVTEKITQCLAQDKPWKIEFRLRTKKGEYKWILGIGKAVEKDDTGHPLRSTGIHLDISESKSLEEERQKVVKLESVGVLAGGIAHDFNNILAAILGNIELASHRTKEDMTTASLLADAQKAAKRAAKLTQQLLTFSKGGSPVLETASLPKLITESADFVLHGSLVSCNYIFPDDLWVVNIDSGQVGQVIQNLAINAKQAMPDGGAITIRCDNVVDIESEVLLDLHEGNFVRITIQDTGVGIPEKIIVKVFDPYFSTKQEGNGLGLAICHSIISKHGGHITVRSTPGNGTTFCIYLPAIQSTNVAVDKASQPRAAMKTLRILVMDDDEMIRNVAQAQLSSLGHETVLVVDGEQAIKKYQELQDSSKPVDLIIMDLTIPGGMGGQEAAREILRKNPEAKIIVSSGYSTDPVMANYQKYGFCAAIAKPFDLKELRNSIESALS